MRRKHRRKKRKYRRGEKNKEKTTRRENALKNGNQAEKARVVVKQHGMYAVVHRRRIVSSIMAIRRNQNKRAWRHQSGVET